LSGSYDQLTILCEPSSRVIPNETGYAPLVGRALLTYVREEDPNCASAHF
jgi:hypothetical protein